MKWRVLVRVNPMSTRFLVTCHRLASSSYRTGKYYNVVTLSLYKNVAGAKLKGTSLSADVFIRTPFVIIYLSCVTLQAGL